MIQKQRQLFYFVGDKPFQNLADAQSFDLEQLMKKSSGGSWDEAIFPALSLWLLNNAAEVVDILTTTPTSRLKARKTHGGTKAPRKPKLKPVVDTKS
jgi:hypothetical protein